MLDVEASIYEPRAIDCSDETSRENKRMITAIEKTYDEIRIKHQVRDMEVEHSLDKMAEFLKLTNWRREKYGTKYSKMDFQEIADEEARQELAHRYNPNLFDDKL